MKTLRETFDVIVIGGGHAGTEAALVAARMGMEAILLTHSSETLGQMSCNPSIGGIGKGQLVKEIDALGGIMGIASDQAGIQFRILNASKGPAVRATRGQMDRVLYRKAIRTALENQPHLAIFQDAVEQLLIEKDTVQGVVTKSGQTIRGKTVVLTTGTFLNGKIHVGLVNYSAGRMGDPPAIQLAEYLRTLPFRVSRLKTGTPPRLDGKTIRYDLMEEQKSDDSLPVFSFMSQPSIHPRQISCYITQTNLKTHEIIKANLDRSPLYRGDIKGIGPRYCPSIEDKVVRFADKNSHHIFIEPEGLDTYEVYPNGISTSLPFDVQYDLVHSIAGLENVHITRPGYAIEYDFFDPRDLKPSLETKLIQGLFFAGQINGTTGYEEAAAQGLIAGLNAARLAQGQPSWTPRRDEAYMGVLIDDLVTRGVTEPYRIFTSRAEYRLILREDNADLRLTEKGRDLGLVDDARWARFCTKKEAIERGKIHLEKTCVQPDSALGKEIEKRLSQSLAREFSLADLLKRPEITAQELLSCPSLELDFEDREALEQLEVQIKYAGYIDRQYDEIERHLQHENMSIPEDIDYLRVTGLSTEVRQRLNKHRPASIGVASRLSGITPAAISLLLVYLKRNHWKNDG